MNDYSNYIALITLLAAFLVWNLGIRAALISLYRQRLFTLRDELFDKARAGRIAFNDPSYTKTREDINALIHYARRMTFFTAILGLLYPNPSSDQESPPVYHPVTGPIMVEAMGITAIHLMLMSPHLLFVLALIALRHGVRTVGVRAMRSIENDCRAEQRFPMLKPC